MKKLLIGVAYCLSLGHAFGQKTELKALKIGKIMPDYTFPTMFNYTKDKLNLKGLKGRYVILDFWQSHCGDCINLFPHMQELQNKFKDKIAIVLVNDGEDSLDVVRKVLARVKKNTGMKIDLPISLFDIRIDKYFPHRSEPHEVIIDPNGKVLAITGGINITEQNIINMLEGKENIFPVKNDFLNKNIPMIALPVANIGENLLMSSTLTRYNSSLSVTNGEKLNSKHEIIGKYVYNTPLNFFYQDANPEFFQGELPFVIYETKNPVIQYHMGDTTQLFCYDIIIRNGQFNSSVFQKFLKEDLDRTFGFILKREKRTLPCLVVTSNANINKYKPKITNEDHNNLGNFKTAIANHTSIYAENQSAYWVVLMLNYNLTCSMESVKVVDETQGAPNIDIEFPVDFDFKNSVKLTEFLHEHGIDVTTENRDVDCLIISDKPPAKINIEKN